METQPAKNKKNRGEGVVTILADGIGYMDWCCEATGCGAAYVEPADENPTKCPFCRSTEIVQRSA